MRRTRYCCLLVIALLAVQAIVPLAGSAAASTPEPGDLDAPYFGAVPWELPSDAEEMRVDSVIDGDTLRLTKPDDDWYEKYRLIGIQAPEMDGPWTDEECYGPEAKAWMQKTLPPGTTVYIQKDIEDKDRNDRFLRHVFLYDEETENAYLLSEVLVLGGLARAHAYPPNDLYDDVLADAQRIADKDDNGLWGACAA